MRGGRKRGCRKTEDKGKDERRLRSQISGTERRED